MEKKTVKAVTRKQKYLAAIAGDGVAPSPITSDEKLLYNIAEKTNEGGGSGGDDTEYVTFTMNYDLGKYVCDHSHSQIKAAMRANKKVVGVVAAQEEGSVMKSFLPSFFDGPIDEALAVVFYGVGVSTDHGLPVMSTVEAKVTAAGAVAVTINRL